MSSSLSYSILGTGALGGYYGGLLLASGRTVRFLARSDFATIRDHGLRLQTKTNDYRFDKVDVYCRPQDMPKSDVVIVSMKTTENHQLPELLEKSLSSECIVLLLQNGLGIEQDVEQWIGKGRVIGGCCFLCSNKVGPGHIRHLDYGRIAMGWASPASRELARDPSVIEQIANDLRESGVPTEVSESLARVRWQKLMWNIPYNGLSVALNASTSEIMTNEASTELASDLMEEVRLGAQACGERIEREFAEKLLSDTRKMVPYDSSMRLDYLNKRPMELEAIYHRPIQAASAAGYTMPRVTMLYNTLQFLQWQSSKT